MLDFGFLHGYFLVVWFVLWPGTVKKNTALHILGGIAGCVIFIALAVSGLASICCVHFGAKWVRK
jgi:hypothetical protein